MTFIVEKRGPSFAMVCPQGSREMRDPLQYLGLFLLKAKEHVSNTLGSLKEQEVERVRRKEAIRPYQALLCKKQSNNSNSKENNVNTFVSIFSYENNISEYLHEKEITNLSSLKFSHGMKHAKPELEKDPQGREANPYLDQSDLDKLFSAKEYENGKTVFNSWSTTKRLLKDDPKLEKDPQGREANPHLDQSNLDKLFREHIKSLYDRCAHEYKPFLADVITTDVAAKEYEDGKTVF
ncbi:pre-mRNA-processing protein 40C isoform X1 [Tanacetum coccineum]